MSAAEVGFGEGAAATESHRFSCVGAELPMLMRRDGAARIHEVSLCLLLLSCPITKKGCPGGGGRAC